MSKKIIYCTGYTTHDAYLQEYRDAALKPDPAEIAILESLEAFVWDKEVRNLLGERRLLLHIIRNWNKRIMRASRSRDQKDEDACTQRRMMALIDYDDVMAQLSALEQFFNAPVPGLAFM